MRQGNGWYARRANTPFIGPIFSRMPGWAAPPTLGEAEERSAPRVTSTRPTLIAPQGIFLLPRSYDRFAALRELTRTRKQLGREVTAHSQRIEKVLESTDVKLAAVLRPLLAVSGRAILAALVAGETDPDRLVALAHPGLRAKRPRCARRCPDASGRIIASCYGAPAGGRDAAGDDCGAGRGDRGGPRPVSRRRGPRRDDPRREHDGGAAPGRGDRHGHEPLRHRGAPGLLGGPVPAPGCERRKAPLRPAPQGRAPLLEPVLIQGAWAAVRGRGGVEGQDARIDPE